MPQWIGMAIARLDQRDRLGRALGIEVPRAELRPPAPDRDQGQVERAQLGHLVEQIGVTGEVDAQAVPPRRRSRASRPSCPGAPGSRRARRARRAHVRRRCRCVPPGASSVSAAKPSLAASRPAPTGTTSRVRSRSRSRSEGRSRWSWWTCEMSTASSSSWCARSTGPPTRLRCSMRSRSTGSVRMRAPPSSISTVECPSQVTRRVIGRRRARAPRASAGSGGEPPRRRSRPRRAAPSRAGRAGTG